MTEIHADNLYARLRDHAEAFDRAESAGDWKAARAVWLRMLHAANIVIGEARANRIEADSLEAELLTFRPRRCDKPPAPVLDGIVYVHTAGVWVCAAKEVRKVVYIAAVHGGGYNQVHYAPERVTLCGKKVAYPVSERFTSGGWPRTHELCPECCQVVAAP